VGSLRTNDRAVLLRGMVGVLLASFIAGFFVSDSQGQHPRPEAPLLRLLPLEKDLKGWTLDGEPQTAEGMALFELINGGAEEYVKEGFRQAVIATYMNKEGKRINLDLYEMLSPDSARSIYRKKTGDRGTKVSVGDEAAMEDYYLNFRKGPYQVTLSGYDTQKETLEAILLMGRLVAERIPVSP
jgi:hypothetical protein